MDPNADLGVLELGQQLFEEELAVGLLFVRVRGNGLVARWRFQETLFGDGRSDARGLVGVAFFYALALVHSEIFISFYLLVIRRIFVKKLLRLFFLKSYKGIFLLINYKGCLC